MLPVEFTLTLGGPGPVRLLPWLTMLVQTSGCERTEAEYHATAAAAGFACC